MKTRRKLLLAFDALNVWSYERSKARSARAAAGWTSVRISKETARKLRALSSQLAAVNGDFTHGAPPLAELLEWLADGHVIRPARELADACTAAIAESLERRPPADVHARHLDLCQFHRRQA